MVPPCLFQEHLPRRPIAYCEGQTDSERLGKSEFKDSNGWLGKWKARYNIKRFTICDESGEVQGKTVDSWQERLPEIIAGYKKEDIWTKLLFFLEGFA